MSEREKNMRALTCAWRFVVRKKLKTLIMFGILLCLSTVMLSMVAVKGSTDAAASQVGQQLKAGFTLENNRKNNPGTPRGGGVVKETDIDAVKGVSGVSDHLRRMSLTADLVGAKPLKLPNSQRDYDAQKEKLFGNLVGGYGENNTELDVNFRSGSLKLSQGRHINESDVNKAIIHEDLAKANGLKIGDKLKLKANPEDADNVKKSTEEVEVEIVGLFSGENIKPAQTRVELVQNSVYTDVTTTKQLAKFEKGEEIYTDATFFVESANTLDDVMKQAGQLGVDWKNFQLTKTNQILAGVTGTVKSIYKLVDTMVVATVIFGVVVISLVLWLWARERRRETGILLAVGTSKPGIVAQHILELVLIAIPAFGAAWFAAQGAAQFIGNQLVSQAAKATSKEMASQLGGSGLGSDNESALSGKTLDHVQVMLDTGQWALVCGISLALVCVAVLIASIPTLRAKPKALLTQLS
ncbi:ABC transporter permease [Arachnia propionica]|uniref:ABC transporter permease n=1 Tax=Arachnia propionica TaxID=1750 RepID=UPI0030D2B8F1